MSVEDAIRKFSSRDFVPRELTGNPRNSNMLEDSRGSHSSQSKDHDPSKKISINELIKLHSPVIMGCKLEEVLLQIDPMDYEDLKRPEVLKVLVNGYLTQKEIIQGIIPSHYTKSAVCNGCGPIWLFEFDGDKVLGCPWCFNRGSGLPIPRAFDK